MLFCNFLCNISISYDTFFSLYTQLKKTLQTKNESTERRILKLLKDAEEFKYKLRAFLHSYSAGRHIEKQEINGEESIPLSPSYQATLHVLLKQNSIEQPIHVNIAVRLNREIENL